MKTIGIITALEHERQQLESVVGKCLKTDLYGNFSIKTYQFEDKTIYFANCTIGQIHAAACTQLLLTKYGVEMVFNYGLVGAISSYKVGQSVVCKNVVHYEIDTSLVDNCERGRYLHLDSVYIPLNEDLYKLALSLDSEAKIGTLASGDKFVADLSVKKQLKDEFNADICDMEGAAISLVCLNMKVPCLIVKVVSDSCDGTEYFDFVELLKNTKHKFASFLHQILLAI